MPRLLAIVGFAAFFLVVHNYALNLLPYAEIRMESAKIRPHPPIPQYPDGKFGYSFNYRASLPDTPYSNRSRVRLTADGRELVPRMRSIDETLVAGGGRWIHQGTQVVFSTPTNSDPRTDGHTYVLHSPILYTPTIGRLSLLLLAASLAGSYLLRRSAAAEPADAARRSQPRDGWPAVRSRFPWHVGGAAALLAVALYCNTGTLSPYGNTTWPHVDPTTGFLYNPDHVHFKVLHEFVDGADRAVWDKALLLRRILYPVLAWPFMKLGGFEIGGTVASIALNLAGLVFIALWMRRRFGDQAAIFAAWLIALYPGATYWGGLPYPYALIVPTSLVAMACLVELATAAGRRLGAISLLLGLLYTGYDLIVFFLPASVLLLVMHRRWAAAAATAVVQVLPLFAWVSFLAYGLDQPVQNSNSGVYGTIINSYAAIPAMGISAWWAQVSDVVDVGADIFFGANFIFLPVLFLAAVLLNGLTSRTPFLRAEIALLAAALALFLFNNLSPIYGGWSMRGTWIARLYQPVFPVFVFFVARWWADLPEVCVRLRGVVRALLTATVIGNALIVFGPLLGNPLRLSEYAFYKFYNHTDVHAAYENLLREHGRRPLGFPRPQAPR